MSHSKDDSVHLSFFNELTKIDKSFEDASSADEEMQRKKRSRETGSNISTSTTTSTIKRSKTTTSKSITLRKETIIPELSTPLNDQAIMVKMEPFVQLASIDDLLSQPQYTLFDPNGKPLCDDAKTKLATPTIKPTSSTTIRRSVKAETQIKELQSLLTPVVVDNSITTPLFHPLFQSMFNQLCIPGFDRLSGLQNGLSQTELDNRLHSKDLFLELMNCEFESELLKESGTWYIYTTVAPMVRKKVKFPGCINEEKCVVYRLDSEFNKIARHGINITRQFTPVSIMTEHEYFNLINHDQQPKTRRCCVACHRYTIGLYTLNTRAARLSDTELIKQYDEKSTMNNNSTGSNTTKPPIYQLYRNMYDQPGGYYKNFVILPVQGDCIIEPVARLLASFLHIEIVPDSGGRLSINQDALKWKPDTEFKPRIGESLSHFS